MPAAPGGRRPQGRDDGRGRTARGVVTCRRLPASVAARLIIGFAERDRLDKTGTADREENFCDALNVYSAVHRRALVV